VLHVNDDTSEARNVLRSVWDTGTPAPDLDEDCSPTKVCKNMRGITFDGYAEEGTDLRDAWRQLLAREGKLNPSGGSVRDLVFGSSEQH
jgi:hypothetical protein